MVLQNFSEATKHIDHNTPVIPTKNARMKKLLIPSVSRWPTPRGKISVMTLLAEKLIETPNITRNNISAVVESMRLIPYITLNSIFPLPFAELSWPYFPQSSINYHNKLSLLSIRNTSLSTPHQTNNSLNRCGVKPSFFVKNPRYLPLNKSV
ncbi:MAG: hypothetical protein PHP01_02475 [Phycisphaerae bacterium]|nr:hypothetical protein [Phycisphaerae bacterium]